VVLFPSQCIAVEGVYLEEGLDKRKLVAERIYTGFISIFIKFNEENTIKFN